MVAVWLQPTENGSDRLRRRVATPDLNRPIPDLRPRRSNGIQASRRDAEALPPYTMG